MKKIILLVLSVVLLCSACSNKKEIQKSEPESTLSLDQLKQKDDTFNYPGTSWGTTMTDTEKDLGYTFSKVPFNAEEWATLSLDTEVTEELFKDYRNLNEYDYAEYTVYSGETPVLLKYGDYTAHMTCEFQNNGLRVVYIYFGTTPEKRDERMDYANAENPPETVMDQLIEDLTKLYGDPEIREPQKDIYYNNYYWESNGTRLSVTISGTKDDEDKKAVLYIQKLLNQ